MPEDEEVPDVAEFEGDDEDHHEGNGDVVTEEPVGKSKTKKAESSQPKPSATVFAMPPPEAADQGAIPLGAPASSTAEPPPYATEGTPLKPKGDESQGGNYDSTGASPTKS